VTSEGLHAYRQKMRFGVLAHAYPKSPGFNRLLYHQNGDI
jgi:hypothetical protein